MELILKAKLKEHLQNFLDKNADDLGSTLGIWQDDTDEMKNASLLANACEVVLDAMALQDELEDKFNPQE